MVLVTAFAALETDRVARLMDCWTSSPACSCSTTPVVLLWRPLGAGVVRWLALGWGVGSLTEASLISSTSGTTALHAATHNHAKHSQEHDSCSLSLYKTTFARVWTAFIADACGNPTTVSS